MPRPEANSIGQEESKSSCSAHPESTSVVNRGENMRPVDPIATNTPPAALCHVVKFVVDCPAPARKMTEVTPVVGVWS